MNDSAVGLDEIKKALNNKEYKFATDPRDEAEIYYIRSSIPSKLGNLDLKVALGEGDVVNLIFLAYSAFLSKNGAIISCWLKWSLISSRVILKYPMISVLS